MNPENGAVSFTTRTIDSVATYTCDSGYGLMGVNTRICLETGLWSGEEPTCRSKYYNPQIMGVLPYICYIFGVGLWYFFPRDSWS